jgi:RNA polymerase sigma-70 factor (ECF subfamily)
LGDFPAASLTFSGAALHWSCFQAFSTQRATALTGQNDLSSSRSNARQASSTSLTLLDRAKGGDQSAWRQLEFLYKPLVRWWCRRRGVGTAEDIEDVTQEVFRAVGQGIAAFTKGPKGSFRSWLHTITRYKIGDLYRRKQPVEAAGGSEAQAFLENLPDNSSESSADEDRPTERALLIRRALKLVRKEFQPRTWEAAWRVVVEEQSAADVAAALGINVGAVWTAKSRVLGRLREVLEDLPL